MLIKRLNIIIAAFIVMVMTTLSCDKSTNYNSGYTSFDYSVSDKSYLVNTIYGAKKSIKLAMRQLSDVTVRDALNDMASSGVSVKVVLDTNYAAPALNTPPVELVQGNTVREMDSNFLIIDDKYAVFISSYDISNSNVLYIKIKNEYLIDMLSSEFKQMHELDKFSYVFGSNSNKQKINYLTKFYAGANEVEMYFSPQNAIFPNTDLDDSGFHTYIKSSYYLARMHQVKKSAYFVSENLGNSEVLSVLDNYLDYGVNTGIVFGAGQNAAFVTSITGDSRVSVSAKALPYNLVFLDPGTQFQSMIFTTFSLDTTSNLQGYDGVCLIISGSDVEKIYNSIKSDTGL